MSFLAAHMNQQFSGHRHFSTILWKQYSGACVLLNDRGPLDSFAGCERFPAINRTINETIVENNAAPSEQCGALSQCRRRQRTHITRGNSNEMCIHDLQRESRVVIPETCLMKLVKRVADGCAVIVRIARGIGGYLQCEILTCVPNLQRVEHTDINSVSGSHSFPSKCFHLGSDAA